MAMNDGDMGQLHFGEPVDVWCPSIDNWSGGFAVESNDGDGVRVRRVSDDVLLPAVFPTVDVRSAHSHVDMPMTTRRRL
jgi:hypothetical protein